MTDENDFTPRATPIEKFRNSKTFSSFLDGITLSVVLVLIVVIGLLYFTQIGVNMGMSIIELGFQCAILYAATVSIYLLLRSFARRKGKATKAFEDAFNKVEENSDRIVRENIANKTIEYCRDWEERELASSREHILADLGISLEDFNSKYLKYSMGEIKKLYPQLTKLEIKTIKRAKSVKRLHFDENYLSVYNKSGRRRSPSQFLSTSTLEKLTVLRVIITTAITSIFGVSLALQLIAEFTFATVIMCLFKIIIILVSGTVGMIGGYNMTAVKAVEEMKIKTKEQNRFMRWCGLDLEEEPASESDI